MVSHLTLDLHPPNASSRFLPKSSHVNHSMGAGSRPNVPNPCPDILEVIVSVRQTKTSTIQVANLVPAVMGVGSWACTKEDTQSIMLKLPKPSGQASGVLGGIYEKCGFMAKVRFRATGIAQGAHSVSNPEGKPNCSKHTSGKRIAAGDARRKMGSRFSQILQYQGRFPQT